MKKNLLTKIRNRKGFTLAELLIVVAIIGVLVAISIPIFTAQLEKAREATDLANMRAAKAAYYDAQAGTLVAANAGKKYGKGTKTDGGNADAGLGYTATTEASGKDIKVVVNDKGECTFTWE